MFPPVPTPHACPSSFSHSSPVAEWANHCPTDISAHPSPVPLSPIPLRSAAASRPSGNTCSHPPNPHWRPGASGARVGSSSSSPKADRCLSPVKRPHTALLSLGTCPCNRHRGRPDARLFLHSLVPSIVNSPADASTIGAPSLPVISCCCACPPPGSTTRPTHTIT